MFNWLLLVGTDQEPDLTVSGIDYQKISLVLGIVALFLLFTTFFFYIKYFKYKEKYEDLKFKIDNNIND